MNESNRTAPKCVDNFLTLIIETKAYSLKPPAISRCPCNYNR